MCGRFKYKFNIRIIEFHMEFQWIWKIYKYTYIFKITYTFQIYILYKIIYIFKIKTWRIWIGRNYGALSEKSMKMYFWTNSEMCDSPRTEDSKPFWAKENIVYKSSFTGDTGSGVRSSIQVKDLFSMAFISSLLVACKLLNIWEKMNYILLTI